MSMMTNLDSPSKKSYLKDSWDSSSEEEATSSKAEEPETLAGSEHLCHAKAFEEHIHRHAEAVLMIVNETLKKVGTGCLIGGDLLITNHHVISSSTEAEQSKAKLWYLNQATPKNSKGSVEWEYLDFNPNAYFFTCENNIDDNGSLQPAASGKLDFTIVALKHTPYLAKVQNACLPLFSNTAKRPSGSVCVIHHPSQVDAETQIKGARQRSIGAIKKIEGCTLQYDASAMGGSSGSPVIDRNGNFIGLHHQGENCPCHFQHSHSFAVLTKQIAQHLSSKEEQAKLQAQIKQAEETLSKLKLVGTSVTPSIIELPAKDPKFCGRDKELKALQILCSQNKRIAITGLGGVGKTALAVEYTNQCHSHEIVYFIDGSDPTTIELGLLRLAKELGVIGQNASEQLDNLKIRLKGKPNCLLIFDGVDSEPGFEYLETHLPTQIRCIIITTRMPEEGEYRLNCVSMPLKEFPLKDALIFIEERTEQTESAKDLAEKLGCLPLALTHACAYINQRKITISRFLKNFSKKQTALFGEPISKPTKEQTILTTWSMSLLFMSPETLDLFNFCSFLAPGDIPYSLLEQWLKEHCPAKDIDTLIKELRDYSMLSAVRSEQYAIHSLVQQVIRGKLSSEETTNYLKSGVDLFAPIAEAYSSNKFETWAAFAPFMPHLKTALAYAHELGLSDRVFQEKVGDLENTLGCYLLASACLYNEATAHCLKALELWKGVLGEKHPSVATGYNNVGITLGEVGRHEEALEYKIKALELFKEVLGEKHPDVATSYNNVGSTLGEVGRHEEALEYLIKALELRKEVLGEKHPSVATSYNNVGITLGEVGRHEEALEYKIKALELFKEVLGEKHPDVATSYNNVGITLGEVGRHEEALEYLIKALELFKEVLGEKHPSVATSYNNVGSTLGEVGRHEEALEYLIKALELRKEVLGEKHPSVATSYNNVGSTLGEVGRQEEALWHLEQARAILEAIFQETHPHVTAVYGNLAECLKKLEKNEEASAYEKKALNPH